MHGGLFSLPKHDRMGRRLFLRSLFFGLYFRLYFERFEGVNHLLNIVFGSIIDDRYFLFGKIDLYVLDAFAQDWHVVHNLLHAVVAVDVRCKNNGLDLFLHGLFCLGGGDAQAHDEGKAKQCNFFHNLGVLYFVVFSVNGSFWFARNDLSKS